MNALMQGTSAAVGVICLVAAGCIEWFGRRHTPRLMVALVITGVAGLMGTQLGRWLNTGVTWINNATGSVLGRLTGVALGWILAAVAVYVVVIHVKDREIDRRTFGAAAVLPVSAAAIPGVVGSVVVTVLGLVTGCVGWAIGWAFGIG